MPKLFTPNATDLTNMIKAAESKFETARTPENAVIAALIECAKVLSARHKNTGINAYEYEALQGAFAALRQTGS